LPGGKASVEAGTAEFYSESNKMPGGTNKDMSPSVRGWEGARIRIPSRGALRTATVLGKKRSADGEAIGTYNDNPVLDTSVYRIYFKDDDVVEDIASNTIAEAIYQTTFHCFIFLYNL